MWINGRWVTYQAAGEGAGAGGAGGGGGAADWRAALPEEQRSAAFLSDIKDLPTLVKNYGEALAYRGSSIRIPGPEAAAEARLEFVKKLTDKVPDLVLLQDGDDEPAKAARDALWQRLGKPKDAKEYTLEGVDGADQLNADELRGLAATVGLTKGQFRELAKLSAEGRAKVTREHQEAVAALRKEWGAAADERLAAAAATALKLGDADLAKTLSAGQASPAVAKLLFAVSKMAGEPREGALQGGNGGGNGKPTPAEAQARLAEIRANPAYWNSRHPQHEGLKRQAVELTAMAHPDLK